MEFSDIAKRILEGDESMQLLAAQGLVPLPVDELIEIQVLLTKSDNLQIATLSKSSLESLDPNIFADAVGSLSNRALEYFVENVNNEKLLLPIVRVRNVPTSLLKKLAKKGNESIQEAILLRQDKIVEDPSILDSLEKNPSLTEASKIAIDDLRFYLLRHVKEPTKEQVEEERETSEQAVLELESSREAVVEEVIEEGEVVAEEEEVDEIIESAKQFPPGGEKDELTGLTEAQIRQLPVPKRVKLARRASSRSMRAMLIKDPNPQVALAVLQGGGMSDQEIEMVAKNRTVSEDVLEAIARNKRWVAKYPIVISLVNNPRTPPGVAVRLLSRLSVRDLKMVMINKNISETVRATAKRIFRVKSK